MGDAFIHDTADVSDKAKIGNGTKVWNWVQIREDAVIGEDCVISKSAYIDHHVKIGNKVKVQNNVSIYFDCEIEDGVFIAPHVCFTNDKLPRSVNPDMSPKGGGTEGGDWEILKTTVREGASIGANSTVLSGIEIGRWALIAAGAIVTKSVPDHGLVVGCPARLAGFVCKCARQLSFKKKTKEHAVMRCEKCDEDQLIPLDLYESL